MPKKPPAVIRFVLEGDASGAPVNSEHTMPLDRVWLNDVQRYSNLVLHYTREYDPTETDRVDAYRFSGHSSGSGSILLEGFTSTELTEARDQLRLQRIARRLGRADPAVRGPSGFMAYFPWVPRTPRADLIVGLVGAFFLLCMIGFGVLALWFAATFGTPLGIDILPVVVVVVIGAGLTFFGFWRYARRRAWWAEARAVALSDYGTLPAYLRR